jgi:hypothetical protein
VVDVHSRPCVTEVATYSYDQSDNDGDMRLFSIVYSPATLK